MSGAGSVPNHLASLAESLNPVSLRQMFVADPSRAKNFSRTLNLGDSDLLADFSKQRVNTQVLDALVAAAREKGVLERLRAMIAGETINNTENRAVTHVAMRSASNATAPESLRSVADHSRNEMRKAVESVPGHITHVVNLGIGGSDLGPALLCDALTSMRPQRREVRFASNVDPVDLDRALAGLDARATLFVVCSKSFGTSETLANARRAAAWLAAGGVTDTPKHFLGVTSQPERVASSGLPIGRVLSMPESVGGRYSVSSAVSISVAIAFGMDALEEIRDGMRLVDEHFVSASPIDNIPLLHGLLWWWNSAVLGLPSVVVVPYSRSLMLLPSYLQQLIMESNGKSVDRDGHPITVSSPVVWGGVGTNAQHAFFQLLHQGTQVVPCDFVGHSASLGSSDADHDTLISNMIAQSQALAFGVSRDEVVGQDTLRSHRATPGNRPSTTLLFSRLTPRALGALIATYEHSTFVTGVMYGLNSFDQWGVELGKQLAAKVSAGINGTPDISADSSTASLIAQHRQWRNPR